MLRRLYDWVLHWAETPYGSWALFFLAFCESSFFPIPPDILLIALAVSIPKKSFKYALICSVGSILGGCLGYLIGWQFMAGIGERIISFYGLGQKFEYIKELYITNMDVAEALEGLPTNKLHCSNLGADALQLAIKDYENKKAGIIKPAPIRVEKHEHTHGDKCYCPYCDIEISEDVKFCEACQSNLEEHHH